MKILLLKPSSLGDVVQALPVLRLLRRHLPDSQLYWWVDSNLAPLLDDDPDLTGIVRFERRGWASLARWREFVRQIHWLRAQRFDWVIDLQSLARSGVVAWLANGHLTVGLDESREGARGFYDWVVPRPSFRTHAVDWYLQVLVALRVPVDGNFEWLPLRTAVAATIRDRWPEDGKRWVLIQPGARWPNKRWPVESFIRAIQQLAATDASLRFGIMGGDAERALGAELCNAVPERCTDLTGQLTLPEMVEWIRRCALFLSNDTGPMHVAAALRRPLVAIFGPTSPWRTGPYGQPEAVLQANLPCVPCLRSRCHHSSPLECLHRITPEMVVERVRQRLNAG